MSFIQIDRKMFYDRETVFKIGAESLTIYSLLLSKRGLNSFVDFTIKGLISFTDREVKTNTVLKYPDKDRSVPKLKSLKVYRKYLKVLIDNGYIKLINEVNIDTVGINETIIVSIEPDLKDGFIQVDTMLFINNINRIGHNGWLIFCILYNLHNPNYGDISYGGYANPTLRHMSDITGMSEKTVSIYCKLLDSCKLVSITENPPILEIDKHGNEYWRHIANNYRVLSRINGNKYFITP